MKWWGWVVIGLVAGAAIVLLWRGPVSDDVHEWKDKLAAEEARSEQLRLADSVRQVRIDSLERVIAAVPKDSLDRMTRLAALASQRAREAAQAASLALGQARSAGDSLDVALVALGASEAHRDTLEQEVGILRVNLEATARMLALTRQVQQETAAQRDSARVDAGRWKLRAVEAESVIDQMANRPKFGRAIETVAIGATTANACKGGVLTVGCVAGVLVTVNRVL